MYSKIWTSFAAYKPKEPVSVEGVDIIFFDMETETSAKRPF